MTINILYCIDIYSGILIYISLFNIHSYIIMNNKFIIFHVYNCYSTTYYFLQYILSHLIDPCTYIIYSIYCTTFYTLISVLYIILDIYYCFSHIYYISAHFFDCLYIQIFIITLYVLLYLVAALF